MSDEVYTLFCLENNKDVTSGIIASLHFTININTEGGSALDNLLRHNMIVREIFVLALQQTLSTYQDIRKIKYAKVSFLY